MEQQKEKATEMLEEKNLLEALERLDEAQRKLKYTDLIAVILGLLGSVFAGVISLGVPIISKPQYLAIIGIAIGSIAVVISFVAVLKGVKRKSSRVQDVKAHLQSAFLQALDNSFLNPNKHAGDKHA